MNGKSICTLIIIEGTFIMQPKDRILPVLSQLHSSSTDQKSLILSFSSVPARIICRSISYTVVSGLCYNSWSASLGFMQDQSPVDTRWRPHVTPELAGQRFPGISTTGGYELYLYSYMIWEVWIKSLNTLER